MTLPPGFIFSQGSLQDYVDCPRRFELRYILGIAWPTPIAENALEAELRLERGADFHRLVHQHLVGIPPGPLTDSIGDAELLSWWQAYLRHGPPLAGEITPEAVLSIPIGGYRLLARLDVVAAMPGERMTIVDWKTNQRRPRRPWLERRLQTLVYRFVLARAGTRLNAGLPVDPATVEMLYWFAQFPAQPERFGYDVATFAEDERFLSSLVGEIQNAALTGQMPLSAEHRTCTFCRFKTLCERDVASGDIGDLDDQPDELSFDFDVDLEQVAEVDF